jgi:hypothetical protein
MVKHWTVRDNGLRKMTMIFLFFFWTAAALQLVVNPQNVSQASVGPQWQSLTSVQTCDNETTQVSPLAVKTNSSKISVTFSSLPLPAMATISNVSVVIVASAFVMGGPGAAPKTTFPGTLTTLAQSINSNVDLPNYAEYNLTAVHWKLGRLSVVPPVHVTFSAYNWGTNPRVVLLDCLQLHVDYELAVNASTTAATTTAASATAVNASTTASTTTTAPAIIGSSIGGVVVLLVVVVVVLRCRQPASKEHDRELVAHATVPATVPANDWQSARDDSVPLPSEQPVHQNYDQLRVDPTAHYRDLPPATNAQVRSPYGSPFVVQPSPDSTAHYAEMSTKELFGP